jgi:hypothetical protein
MIGLFFVYLLKGQFSKNFVAVRWPVQSPANQGNQFSMDDPPPTVWKIVAVKRAILKFKKRLVNLSLDQN